MSRVISIGFWIPKNTTTIKITEIQKKNPISDGLPWIGTLSPQKLVCGYSYFAKGEVEDQRSTAATRAIQSQSQTLFPFSVCKMKVIHEN